MLDDLIEKVEIPKDSFDIINDLVLEELRYLKFFKMMISQ